MPMLVYMVKVAIYLVAFYLIYSLMLRRDTTHSRNRAFIIFSLAASVILPFVSFNTSKPMDIQAFGKLLSEVFVTSGHGVPEKVELREIGRASWRERV